MEETDRAPSWLDLESIQKMPVASKITSLSPDTIRREYPHLVVQLSPRRDGMRLRDALAIAAGKANRRT
jgi:hypothetical protein